MKSHTRNGMAWLTAVVSLLVVCPSGGRVQEVQQQTESKKPRNVLIIPGIWTPWFDAEPPQGVKDYLRSEWKKKFPPDAQEQLPPDAQWLTEVKAIKTNSDGTTELTTCWIPTFHWNAVYQAARANGDNVLVVLEPGPPVDTYLKECRSDKDWLGKHSHNGGVRGHDVNETLIMAAISALGQVDYILAHSQAGLNFLSSLAREPGLFEAIKGATVLFMNPAWRTEAYTSLVNGPIGKAKGIDPREQPSVRDLSGTDIGVALLPFSWRRDTAVGEV